MTATAHLVTVGAMPAAGADGAAVADALAAEGIALASRVFIEDDEAALERALGHDDALTVVLAGGGGSAGDSVRRVLARATGTRLVLNERVLAALQERYRRLDRPLPRRAERLALLPQGATVWVTADAEAGWTLESGQRAFAVLARAATAAEATRSLAKAETGICALLGEDCYGLDGETLELVVGRMLLERRLTLAVAESCTGGLLGHRLTSVPGSSSYFERGVLAYSNQAKEERLGVPESILRTHGPASAPCAEAMARAAADLASAPCGLAITGVTDADSGSP